MSDVSLQQIRNELREINITLKKLVRLMAEQEKKPETEDDVK